MKNRFAKSWKTALVFSFALWGMLFTQAQEPSFRHFSVADGLATSEVYGIFQDRDGYIWLATEFGASRYNGYDFQHYSTDDGLSDNTVFEMYQDFKGRVWFHTFNGVPCYYYGGKFTNFLGHENVNEGDLTTSVLETSDSMVWMSSKARYVMGITPDDSAFFLHLEYTQLGTSFPSHFVNRVPTGREGEEFFISTTGFYKYNSSTQDFEDIELNCVLGMANPHFTAADTNYFWSSMMETIMQYMWDGQKWSVRRELTVPNKEYVTSLYIDKQKRLWVGTYKGVFVWYQGQWWDLLLEDYAISDVMEDREGNFWFTTLKNGVFMASSMDLRGWNISNGLGTERLTALKWNEERRELWMGNSEGTLVLKKGTRITIVEAFPSEERRSPEIGAIQFKGDTIIVGTNSGLIFADDQGKEFRRVLTFGAVKSLYEDKLGKVWACITSGVYALSPEVLAIYDSLATVTEAERAHYLLKNDPNSLRRGRTTAMVEDRNGDFWFGGLDGVERVRKVGDSTVSERVSELKFTAEDILEDEDGGIWIASHGGGLLHCKDDSITILTRENGLGSNLCKKLALNGKQGVWVGSNQGVTSVVAPGEAGEEYAICHYSDLDGLISSEVNDLLVIEDTLWLATNGGLGYMPLRWGGKEPFPPTIALDSMVVNGQHRDTADLENLGAAENNLSIHFSGISFRSRGAIEYGYKLNGEPASWRKTESRKVDFLSLSPGEYTFEVWASDYRGNRSLEATKVHFTIMKPWYQRWWALTGGALALISFIFLGFRQRLKNIESRQALRNSAEEADQRALRAQITPHFVFNALNSLQALIADNRRVDALKYTSRFARLMRRIFEQSIESYVALSEELETLELYLQIEQMRFKDRFTYKIEVEDEVKEDALIPSMLLQPIAENSIWHGLLHQEVPGEILVRVTAEKEELVCMIQDNGIGRKASQKIQSRFSEKSKSSGLKVTEDRIRTLSRLNNIDLKLKITDLFGEDDRAVGTRVEFTIPFLTTTALNEK